MSVVIHGTNGFSEPTGYLFGPPQGRLTLVTATPVMISSQSAKTTIYYAPYNGNLVPIYNGTTFVPTLFSELSQATTDTTKSPAAVATNGIYDMFVWNDSGTIRCTRGPVWTTTTAGSSARGTGAATTELERVLGLLVNKYDITNGPAAQRGTYVGTVYSDQSNAVSWILGAASSGGTAGVLGVWNAFNRVDVATMVKDTTDSWTHNSTTPHATNASNTNRVTFVAGLQEDSFFASNMEGFISGSNVGVTCGIGFNSTSAFSGRWPWMTTGATASSLPWVQGEYADQAFGLNYCQALEGNIGAGTLTYNGDNGGGNGNLQQGLLFEFRM